MGLMDFIDMSSPLHNIAIYFRGVCNLSVLALTGIMRRIAGAYYGCSGLDHPRTVNHLTISSRSEEGDLVFDARSYPICTPYPTSNLKLHFNGVGDELVEETFTLFPLKHVCEFTAEGLSLVADDWWTMFRMMKNLSHLRLDNLDIRAVLNALYFDDQGMYKEATGISSNHLHVHR